MQILVQHVHEGSPAAECKLIRVSAYLQNGAAISLGCCFCNGTHSAAMPWQFVKQYMHLHAFTDVTMTLAFISLMLLLMSTAGGGCPEVLQCCVWG